MTTETDNKELSTTLTDLSEYLLPIETSLEDILLSRPSDPEQLQILAEDFANVKSMLPPVSPISANDGYSASTVSTSRGQAFSDACEALREMLRVRINPCPPQFHTLSNFVDDLQPELANLILGTDLSDEAKSELKTLYTNAVWSGSLSLKQAKSDLRKLKRLMTEGSRVAKVTGKFGIAMEQMRAAKAAVLKVSKAVHELANLISSEETASDSREQKLIEVYRDIAWFTAICIVTGDSDEAGRSQECDLRRSM